MKPRGLGNWLHCLMSDLIEDVYEAIHFARQLFKRLVRSGFPSSRSTWFGCLFSMKWGSLDGTPDGSVAPYLPCVRGTDE